jgi:VanZ family protein
VTVYPIAPVYAAASVWHMGLLLLVSSMPGAANGTPAWRFIANVLHAPAFAGLGLWLALAFDAWPTASRGAWVLAIGIGYAVLSELHQLGVPGRSASAMDVAVDVVGLVIALCLVMVWRARRA